MPAAFASLPSLNALRVFEVVSRHLNFSRAAEELGVTQAAVAQQIRGLEASLAIRLFERLPRGLALTDNGRAYSASVRQAFAQLQDATQLLKPQPLHITVSVTPTLASKWLIPRLGAFSDANPDIDLRVLATDRLAHFQTDGVDLAVRYGKPPFGAGLNETLLMNPPILAVASPALLAEKGSPRSFAALQQFLVLHDAHDLWHEYTAALFAGHPPPTARNLRFNQTSLAIEAALNGQGIALASHAFVKADIVAGRLVPVCAPYSRVDKAFYLVWPRRAGQTTVLQVVMDWLKQEALDSSSTE